MMQKQAHLATLFLPEMISLFKILSTEGNADSEISQTKVALGALRAVHGMEQVTENLNAEEMVDDHREKTVTLLWAFLGS